MTVLENPYAKIWVELLRRRVSERTFDHTISTAEFMRTLAPHVGIAEEDAVTAALLHDLWKGHEPDEYLAAARACGLEITEVQQRNPGLLHGPLAAIECRFQINEAVYEAIYWHTTGKPGLGPLALALYFADFAEPTRTFPESIEARIMLERDGFYPALRMVSEQRVDHIRAKPNADPMTEAFHRWLTETIPA